MKIYPEEMIVTFIYNLSVVILIVPVSLLAESNMSSWRLRPSIVAASILYSVRNIIISTTIVSR